MSDVAEIAAPRFTDKGSLIFATTMVIISCIGFGTVPFFVKGLTEAGIPSSVIPFYRYLFSAIVLLPFLIMARNQFRTILWGFASGACLGIGWIGYVEALKLASVSTVGVLYMTYPIFTILIAWLWLKENPTARAVFASLLVLFAAAIVMRDVGGGMGLKSLLFSLLAPLSFGLSINILVSKLSDIPPLARVPCIALGAIVGLSVFIMPLGVENILPKAARGWYLLLGIGLITATVPQIIYSKFAPLLGSTKSAIAGSVELPTMFVVGWLAFGESIGLLQYISAVLVIIGIAITPGGQAQRRVSQ